MTVHIKIEITSDDDPFATIIEKVDSIEEVGQMKERVAQAIELHEGILTHRVEHEKKNK